MKIAQCTIGKNCIYSYFPDYFYFFNNFITFFHQFIDQFFPTLTFFIIQILAHSDLLGFQIYPLSHTPLSINSLHSHLHLSSFQRCLLLQTFASSLHLHLHVSCHFMSLVSLVFYIGLNTLTFKFFTTSGTHIFAYGSYYYNYHCIYLFWY